MSEQEKKRLFKDEYYFSIFGWMSNPDGMNLNGNELNIYAVIFGLSQGDDQYFTGSIKYLSDCLNISERSIKSCLKSLVQKGCLQKIEVKYNCYKYKAIVKRDGEESSPQMVKKVHHDGEESSPQMVKNLHHDGEESSPNNIDILKINILGDKQTATRKTNKPKNQFNNFKQRDNVDFDELEKKLLGGAG